MNSKLVITIVQIIFIFLFGCSNKTEQNEINSTSQSVGFVSDTITQNNYNKLFNLLIENQFRSKYEIDTIIGYIKSGCFWNDSNKYAIIINFENSKQEADFHILKFNSNSWEEIFFQSEVGFIRTHQIIPKFDDYNFDGIVDIAFKYVTSNGGGITSYFLWLKTPSSFEFIKKFSNVTSPEILKDKKIIKSFWACCAFGEIAEKKYVWKGNNLILIDSCYTVNYPNNKYKEHYKLHDGDLKLVQKN